MSSGNHGYEPKSKLWKLCRSKLRGIIPSAARDCSTYQSRSAAHTESEFHNNFFNIKAFAFLISIFSSTIVQAASNNTDVETAYGVLRGYVNNGVMIWKGVPYAQPPVNELRWKATQEPVKWDGIREATKPAKKSTQLLVDKDWQRTGAIDPDSSDDCLYVDIYRPQRPAFHKEKLPVYVWIHGGSNHSFSSKDYDWSALAHHSNVVVVSVQYRLGPLGWFFHPAIQTGGTDKLVGLRQFWDTGHNTGS